MSQRTYTFRAIAFTFIVLALLPDSSWASETQELDREGLATLGYPAYSHGMTAPADRAQGGDGESVTILVLDMSGSLAGRDRDPEDIRCSAARMYVDLALPTDFIGLVVFPGRADDTRSDVVIEPELPIGQQHRSGGDIVCHSEGNTPMLHALQQAHDLLLRSVGGGRRTGSVVLMSDGEPYPDTGGQEEAIRQLLPAFRERGWWIDTIALVDVTASNTHFLAFMREVADETGGRPYVADTALRLHPYFLSLVARRTGRPLAPAMEPLILVDGSTQERTFQVSRFARHIDLVVTHDTGVEVTLFRPGTDGAVGLQVRPEDSDLRLHLDEPHAVAYSISNPAPGDWTLRIRGTPAIRGEARVVADLMVDVLLRIDLLEPDRPLPADEEFRLVASILQEDGSVIVGEQVQVLATITDFRSYTATTYLHDDGTGADERRGDGLYSGGPMSLPPGGRGGSYGVSLQVTVGPVTIPTLRDQILTFHQIPELELARSEVSFVAGEQARIPFRLLLDEQPVGTSGLTLHGYSWSNGRWQPRGLLDPQGLDHVMLLPDAQDGTARLRVVMEGAYEGVVVSRRVLTFECDLTTRPLLVMEPQVQLGPVYPTGWPVTLTVALLDARGVPLPIQGDLSVAAGREGEPAFPVSVRDDGREGDSSAGDGVFTGVFAGAASPGEYDLAVSYAEAPGQQPVQQRVSFEARDFPVVFLYPTPPVTLTEWGGFGTLYRWFPLSLLRRFALTGEDADVAIQGQIRLAGEAYPDWSGGALSVATALSSSLTMQPVLWQPATDADAAFTARLTVQQPGVYLVRAGWEGEYRGRMGYSSSATSSLQASGIAPSLGRAVFAVGLAILGGGVWLVTLSFIVLAARARLAAPFTGHLRPLGRSESSLGPSSLRSRGIDLAARARRRRFLERLLNPARLDASLWLTKPKDVSTGREVRGPGSQARPVEPGLVQLRSRWAVLGGPGIDWPSAWDWETVRPWLGTVLRTDLWRWLLQPKLAAVAVKPGTILRIAESDIPRGTEGTLGSGVRMEVRFPDKSTVSFEYVAPSGASKTPGRSIGPQLGARPVRRARSGPARRDRGGQPRRRFGPPDGGKA